jgi:hypothetical protein
MEAFGLENYKVVRFSPEDGGERDGAVESDQATVMSHGKGEQIDVGHLLGTEKDVGVERRAVEEVDVVGPKAMVGRGGGKRQKIARLVGAD